MKISKILFPTDFSEGSAAAAEYVCDMAAAHDATVYLMHVIYDVARDAGWYGTHINMSSFYDDMKATATSELERFRAANLSGCKKVEKVLLVGKPYEDIIGFVDEAGIDLVVIGSHSRRGLTRLFGSTAQKVVRNAPCSVLTVKTKK